MSNSGDKVLETNAKTTLSALADACSETFEKGRAHGEAMLKGKLMDELIGDKLDFVKEKMFQVAAQRGKTDPQWEAFAEGVRQTLNVLDYRGAPEDAYKGIVNRSMDVRTGETNIKPTL